MKAIILDYFRRYGWTYVLAFCVHVGALMFSWRSENWTSLASVLGGSAFILVAHLNRSGATLTRTLLALPLRANDLSRAWRFVALEFPTLWFLLALALSIIGNQLFSDIHHITIERVVIAAIAQTLLLGGVFFALTGLHHQNVGLTTTWDHVRANLFAMLWGISIPGSIFMAQAIPSGFDKLTPLMSIAGSLLAVATVAGWFRVDILVQRRVERLSENAKPKRSSKSPEKRKGGFPIRGFGGLPLHMAHFSSRAGMLGLAILAINWITLSFFLPKAKPIAEMAELGIINTRNNLSIITGQLQFAVPFLSLILVMTIIGQLRTLRTLPLSRTALTHFLILWPLLFCFLFFLIASAIFGLIFRAPIGWSSFGLAMAASAIVLLGVPVALRRGFGIPTVVMAMVLIAATQVFRVFSDQWKTDSNFVAPLIGIAAITVLLISWIFTYRLLGTHHPWRTGALRLPGQIRRL